VDTKRLRQPNTNKSDQALDLARPVAKGKSAPTPGQVNPLFGNGNNGAGNRRSEKPGTQK
jgi:hypothetical protein